MHSFLPTHPYILKEAKKKKHNISPDTIEVNSEKHSTQIETIQKYSSLDVREVEPSNTTQQILV